MKSLYSKAVVGSFMLFAGCGDSFAGSMSMSYGELKQPFTYMQETVTFKPIGPSWLMSYDLNDNWSVDFDYQKWKDEKLNSDRYQGNIDLKGWGTGLSYYKEQWSFGLSYNHSTDETYAENIRRPQQQNFWEKTKAKSWGLSVGYGWLSGDMFYNLSLSGQVSDWNSDTRETVRVPPPPEPPEGEGPPPGDEPPPQFEQVRDLTSGDVSSVSASFSMARYWPMQDGTGVMLGGMLSWNHMISGESVLVSSTGRRPPPQRPRNGSRGNGRGAAPGGLDLNRAGGGNLSSASGDDSYGQVAFYVSYDLTENWSVDFDTGIDIGTDENDVIWSVSLGYFW